LIGTLCLKPVNDRRKNRVQPVSNKIGRRGRARDRFCDVLKIRMPTIEREVTRLRSTLARKLRNEMFQKQFVEALAHTRLLRRTRCKQR
jgi:hypothetical protein